MRVRRLFCSSTSIKWAQWSSQYVLIAPANSSRSLRFEAGKASTPGVPPVQRLRQSLLYAVMLVLLLIVGVILYFGINVTFIYIACLKFIFHTLGRSPLPPTFEEYYALEQSYPQHNESLEFPEGREGRYLWISNQHYGLGWNNIFEAMYMIAHMSFLSNRAFVFQPYTWHNGPEPFVSYNGKLIPSRIPLAALIDGPIAGGSFPSEYTTPRAVSEEWFKQICPEERRKRISIKEMNDRLKYATALEIMDKYVDVLSNRSESCIEMFGAADEHPFHFTQFGNASLNTIWPSLSVSPIMTGFKWSPIVLSALHRNAYSISPEFELDPLPEVINDLMALHVRRGDFEHHCINLNKWSSPYLGWNQMPGLADTFTPVESDSPDKKLRIQLEHCWPSIERIVARVEVSRLKWEAQPGARPLRRLYVLTNGGREWLGELKEMLEETGDWDIILTSRDLSLTFEQQYVAQAIDMAVAERAAVFIGNGFSSLSANVVLMRSIHNLPMISNHFW